MENFIMRKKVLLPILLITSLYSQITPNELGINAGITSINNDSGSKFNNKGVGITYQLNRYIVMPRFDLDYVKISDFSDKRVDSLFKASINGIYELENNTLFTPYVMGGLGYEQVSDEVRDVFESHPFIQGGLGLNYIFSQGYKAQIEGKILQIIGGNDENNEVIFTFGMSFPLIKRVKRKKIIKRPPRRRIVVVPPPPPPPPPKKPQPIKRIVNGCPIKISAPDRDRDGITDSLDRCPNTPCGYIVDNFGCPIKVTLRINFAINSYDIPNYSIPKIRKFATYLLRNKDSKVLIEGHTDNVGSKKKNLILSQKRAEAVADMLVALGVNPNRITTIGRGESMPIASNSTEEGKRKNRRIEAILTYPKGI
jgi:OOP family OmpA-OmpF porin